MKKLILMVISAAMCFSLSACANLAQEEHITEPSKYNEYFGEDGVHKKKKLIKSSIFPDELPKSANVEKFSYHYYNPWDSNFTNILVYTCDTNDFQMERERLKNIISSTDLSYGTSDFPYELCAVNADDYYGIVYAMSDTDNLRLIYAEITFCNYFSDMNYSDEIGEDFLPIDFDAKKGNPKRQQFEDNHHFFK